VIETVLRALGQLAPGRVLAGSYSTGNNVTGGGVGADGRPFLWYSYQSGGCGARPGKDGSSAEWHLMANSKNEPMEGVEAGFVGGAAAAADYARPGLAPAGVAAPEGFDAGSAPWTKLISSEERSVIARGRYGMESSLGRRPALVLIDVQPSVVGLDRP